MVNTSALLIKQKLHGELMKTTFLYLLTKFLFLSHTFDFIHVIVTPNCISLACCIAWSIKTLQVWRLQTHVSDMMQRCNVKSQLRKFLCTFLAALACCNIRGCTQRCFFGWCAMCSVGFFDSSYFLRCIRAQLLHVQQSFLALVEYFFYNNKDRRCLGQ